MKSSGKDSRKLSAEEVEEVVSSLSYSELVVWTISKSLSRSPGRWLLAFMFIFVGAAGWIGTSGEMKLAPNGEHDWTVAASRFSQNRDAWDEARTRVDELSSSSTNAESEVIDERSQASPIRSITFMFDWKYGHQNSTASIFTPETLQQMCQMEGIVVNHEEYKNYCVLESDGETCAPAALSVVNKFYPIGHNYSCPILDKIDVSFKANMMYSMMETDVGKALYSFYMSENFENVDPKISMRTRSMIMLGTPLRGFKNSDDRIAEQRKLYQAFADKLKDKFFEKFGLQDVWVMKDIGWMFTSGYLLPDRTKSLPATKDLQVLWFGMDILQAEFNRMISGDMMWTLGSITFVFIWIFVHTESLLISSVGMLCIILSLPLAFIILRFGAGCTYFSQLHILAIYIVLGVGADDIFVFADAFKQSAKEHGGIGVDRKHARLYFAYMRSSQAVWNTSFTTAMAFVATAISPIMPVSSFGIFAACAIMFNYVFVLTVIPCTTLISSNYTSSENWLDEPRINFPKFYQLINEMETRIRDLEAAVISTGGNIPRREKRRLIADPETGEEEATDYVEEFFKHIYVPGFLSTIMGIKVVAIVCILGLGVFCAFMASAAIKLTPPTEEEQWFQANHMMQGLSDKLSNDYLGQADNAYENINFVFGIQGVDRAAAGYNHWVPNENRGVAVFDSKFDLADPAAQTRMTRLCDALDTYECVVPGCSGGFGTLVRPNSTKCFMTEFNSWHRLQYSEEALDVTNKTKFYERLFKFRETTKPSWAPITGSWAQSIGFVDGELKFVSITAASTLKKRQSIDTKEGVLAACDKFLKDYVFTPDAPDSFKSAFHDAGRSWIWMVTQKDLVSGLFSGLALCFPVAFFVLLWATGNLVMAIYATVSIAGIVSIVLGWCKVIMGWDLGIAESIAGIIVIGMSVDYVVHLGHMYTEAAELEFETREDRFKFSAEKMGATVFAGAVTTAGAGAFMAPCQMMFFYKMFVLICVTIITSLVYSLLFFMPLVALAGPSGHFAEVFYFCKSEKQKVSASKKEDSAQTSAKETRPRDVEMTETKQGGGSLRYRQKISVESKEATDLTVEDVDNFDDESDSDEV